MELALIDDDTLYQSLFKEFFGNIGIDVVLFSCGNDFIKTPLDKLSSIKFVVMDHTILDITTEELTKSIKLKTKSEVCIISTDGKALDSENNKNLGISGDFKKIELKNILSWFLYFRKEIEKKLQTWG